MMTSEEINALTDEEREELSRHIFNSRQITAAVLHGSAGLPVNDVVSGCLGAIVHALKGTNDELVTTTAQVMYAAADHLTGHRAVPPAVGEPMVSVSVALNAARLAGVDEETWLKIKAYLPPVDPAPGNGALH